jgi:hypothetical protein
LFWAKTGCFSENIYSKKVENRFKVEDFSRNFIKNRVLKRIFELKEKDSLDKLLQYKYISNNGQYFTVLKCTSAMEMNFDTENFIMEEIIVGNIKYTYCQGNEGMDNVLWTRNDYVYRIDGTLSKDELLKIAKTVE